MKDEPRRSLSGPRRVGCLAPGLGAGPHLLRGFNCSDVLVPYVIAGSSSKDVISLIYKSRFSHSFLDQGRLSGPGQISLTPWGPDSVSADVSLEGYWDIRHGHWSEP